MKYVFPNYKILSIEIVDTAQTCDQFIRIACFNGSISITIERRTYIWYECGEIECNYLLEDLEERRKYLEGLYIFRDFPWGIDIEVKINFQ